MTGLYTLGGLDMYTTYGFVPEPGSSDDVLKPRKAKERYSNDWPDENGREWDLSEDPKFEDKQIRIKGHIVGSNESDFWTKYNALLSVFNSSGTKILKVAEFGTQRDVNVFYLDTPVFGRLTRVKGGSKVYVKVEFLLQESQQAAV